MFATGYGDQMVLPPEHRGRIVLQKPYTMASLAQRLPELMAMMAMIEGSERVGEAVAGQ